jgi:signal transduction histidine kinase
MGQRIKRMEAMLDALLQYSKVGSNESEAEAIDSGELVRAVIDYLGLPEQFKAEVADNMPVIATQRAPMELVFRNLISNAVKHHDRDSGTIRVSGEQRGKICAFTVSDDGPGIPEKHQEGVFEMFKTLRPRDEVEGSGMGLALVQKTVERNQRSIKVTSEGRGTQFRFTWAPLEAVQAQRYG